ncbi:hypothetical protein PPTG_15608 [Phytophthora nicotianae INRA-310]|uniref:RxLR effector protein n=2 Tax=Phytophthora nicotianae TaxID=4792 RepID=W2PRN0_PHYN3|nr:hypothetical protein PPTG_15608 [Phytophthora nicotianae INRA-310]ETN03633.1 hypothetical protein PPTG_15608 [Phytophthora nicotianae INRA-310]KUF98098.1 hypothetical protein AM587_10001303 [Phytophthora nicotianae]
MRFVLVLVLLIASLLANGDVVAETRVPDLQSLLRSPSSTQYETHAPKSLRRSYDEERALPVPVPSVSLFTNWVKSMGLKVTNSARARYWLWRKQSVESVFKQLKLDGGLDKILANRKFYAWATYVSLYNKKNPSKEVSMAGILTNTYGDLKLSGMLEVALNQRKQWKMAAVLARQQRENWQAAGKSADDIFVLLKLEQAGDKLFVTPQLNTWYNYVTMLKKDDASATIASVLTAHYGDEAIAKIFREANPRVKRMRFVKVWLETAWAKNRPQKTLSPEEYFKVLKLDDGVDKLLANPKLETWLSYVGKFNAKHPGQETTVIQTLTKFYDDVDLVKALEAAKKVPQTENIATDLQTTLFSTWIRNKISPDNAFKMLKLNADVDTLLTNPNLIIWITYLGQFNAANTGHGTTMIKTFTRFYGDEKLAKMLEAARHVPNTEKVATQFQTAQFIQWMRDGKKQNVIWKMLNMEKATWTKNPDAQVWYRYKDFYKANKHKYTSGQ